MGVGEAGVEYLKVVFVELDSDVVGVMVELAVTKFLEEDGLVIVVLLVEEFDEMGLVVVLLARVENKVVVAFTPVEGDVEGVSMAVGVQEDDVELEFEIGPPPVEVITLDVIMARGVDKTVFPVEVVVGATLSLEENSGVPPVVGTTYASEVGSGANNEVKRVEPSEILIIVANVVGTNVGLPVTPVAVEVGITSALFGGVETSTTALFGGPSTVAGST